MPPAPKPASKRRNRSVPKSYGEAEAVEVHGQVAPKQPELGFDAESLITDMWLALGDSVEAKFFSAADWQRARWELWFANKVLSGQELATASKWATIQEGLSTLLISPADKRRAGIEMKLKTADPDEEAAVAQLDDYRAALKSS